MLVLTRRPGQSIRIGEDIEVTVVEVRGDQVRLAIDAPRHVPVVRTHSAGDPAEEYENPDSPLPAHQ